VSRRYFFGAMVGAPLAVKAALAGEPLIPAGGMISLDIEQFVAHTVVISLHHGLADIPGIAHWTKVHDIEERILEKRAKGEWKL
jgi:hypothetical protein